MNNRINGTRFLNQEELAARLFELDLKETKYPVGGIPLLTMGDKVYVDASDSHSIIFGATGSKKTRMFAMPSIGIFARAGESFVVTDPKGELYERTAAEVEQQDYRMYCLNLRDLRTGEAWNPLLLPYRMYHGGKRAKAMELVNELAVMITGEDSNQDKFWTYTTVDVLAGLIYLLFETEAAENCTLEQMSKLWERYTNGRGRFMEEVKKKFGQTMIYSKLSTLDNNSDKTVGSIEAIVSMALNRIMVNEEMVRYLSRNSIRLEEIAEQKSAVYLIVPDENKTYHFIVSLFLEQLYEVLIQKAQASENKTLGIRMNFLIDEFANIPKIQNMDSKITASRSRNIRFYLIIQSMKQLRHKYEEYADVICSNCNNWVYLYSKEYELLQEISRLCGEVIYDNGIRVPLVSEFDLQHLSREKGEALILSGRNYPCIANMKDIEEYPFARGVRTNPVPAEEGHPAPEEGIVKMTEEQEKKVAQIAIDGLFAEDGDAPRLTREEREQWNNLYDERYGVDRSKYEKRGLLAVGPEGMILYSGVYYKGKLADSIANLGDTLYKVHGIPVDGAEWYSVEEKGIDTYRKALAMGEREFYSLSDFPEYEFTKEKSVQASFRGKGWFQVEVKENTGTDGRLLFQTELPDYGGSLGEFFAKKMFFEVTKTALEKTAYAQKRWNRLPWKKQGEWQFVKRIQGVNELVGCLKKTA
ncbi:MAG: type IV secretory system conjugative DNA transfer family protein [Lachnospiraceae bacterium]|nr:type IV secretory system conjugative DNA transfer family protein [Lachnospiraceae bacterium]